MKRTSSGFPMNLTMGICACLAWGISASAQQRVPVSITPSKMAKLGTVDPRYLSYNIEMVEVTGGRFWKPYAPSTAEQQPVGTHRTLSPNQQVGEDKNLFEYRPPVDLSNARLRKLASALGPSYVRVSGSWANSTYFQDNDLPPLKTAPKGFRSVLTRDEWKGVIDFARAVDAGIVTSVAISPGTRNADDAQSPAWACLTTWPTNTQRLEENHA